MVTRLRNKAPPITIERLSGHYEDIDEISDDELDEEVRSTKAAAQPEEEKGNEDVQLSAEEIPADLPNTPRSSAAGQYHASAGT